ncbi:Sigma-70 family RNA polymerase sigma factor [Sulfidibacter corallicola]|uniref:Sigma-70 family RNA polymerase sigma factor n=1 Tax=Sulfidibacter corallicola TaxID=2818388 RepID=A0A8A4TQ13_SULCO|nr:sigma-70 family RNA polymerase sigma factor [Sulfidibacter corallicola]QTD51633.1 sigma-70 family RNA polymerase sigma factor [Sulfidibacter corallicola]
MSELKLSTLPSSKGLPPLKDMPRVNPPCEPQHFAQLYRIYYPTVLGYFRHVGMSKEKCEDLTQKVFLRVYEIRNGSSAQFRGDSSIKTWLISIARNVKANDLRDSHAEKRGGGRLTFSIEDHQVETGEANSLEAEMASQARPERAGPEQESILLEKECLARLQSALETLPPTMKRCFLLRVKQDLKYREIAVLMGVSIDTVKSHIFQARRALKERMEGYFHA